MLVRRVHGAEDVELDAVTSELVPAFHHEVERAVSAAVDAVRVVELAWTVDAQPDEEIVLLEERAPRVIEENAVGLERVLHASDRGRGTSRRARRRARRSRAS